MKGKWWRQPEYKYDCTGDDSLLEQIVKTGKNNAIFNSLRVESIEDDIILWSCRNGESARFYFVIEDMLYFEQLLHAHNLKKESSNG